MIKLKNNLLNKKRSQIHVEMIMSFIIFVGFIFTILYFINPAKQETVSLLQLNIVQEKLLNNLTINYQYTALILKDDALENPLCLAIENTLGVTDNLLVKDLNDNIVESKIIDDKIYIKTSAVPGNKLYKLYFSDRFKSVPLSTHVGLCTFREKSNYSFGVFNRDSAVFYENIVKLNASYVNDYNGLKNSLAIGNNFDFIVYNLSRSIIFDETSARKLKTSNILAREIPLNVIDGDTNKKDIILNLRVW